MQTLRLAKVTNVKAVGLIREEPMNNYQLVTRKISRITEAIITSAYVFLLQPSR